MGMFPKVADATTWQTGYAPFESQKAYHGLDVRFKGFSGPVGSGKSLALCREALRLAYVNAGRTGVIGAPTYPMLRDVTRAAILEILEEHSIPFAFLKAENSIKLKDCGSKILFRSLKDYERLRGTNLAWFGIDELTYCRREAWDRLEARLRDPKATILEGFAVWTPKGFDWVYRRFVDAGERREGYEAIRAKPGENKALPADFYDRLKTSYDEKFYRQEVLGEYLNIFSGRVYYAFDRLLNCEKVEYARGKALRWTLDFNVNPMCSALCQVIGDDVHVLEEMILGDSNTFAACEEFIERVEKYRSIEKGANQGVPKLNVVVYGDASGDSRRSSADKTDWAIVREFFKRNDHLFDVTFKVGSSNPTVKSRINSMNAALSNYAGERKIKVHPVCKELIADFEQVAWAEGSSSALDKSDDERTHISDALGYLVWKEFGLRQKGGPRSTYLGV